MRRMIPILVVLALIVAMTSCDKDSSDVDKMVQSFYKAINDGDTAKAQSYVSPGNSLMLKLTEAMVSVMAGNIQKVEILDTIRSEGQWGAPPLIGVYVRITCVEGVRPYAPGYPSMWSPGRTCGDLTVVLYKYDSGWKIETTSS